MSSDLLLITCTIASHSRWSATVPGEPSHSNKKISASAPVFASTAGQLRDLPQQADTQS